MNVTTMSYLVFIVAAIYGCIFALAVKAGKKRSAAIRKSGSSASAGARKTEPGSAKKTQPASVKKAEQRTTVKNRSVNRIRDALQKNTERGMSSLLYRNSERMTRNASMDKVVSKRENTTPVADDCDFGDINHAYSHDHEQRLEQLKSFLKNGLIDKKEYQTLVEKYSRQQNN